MNVYNNSFIQIHFDICFSKFVLFLFRNIMYILLSIFCLFLFNYIWFIAIKVYLDNCFLSIFCLFLFTLRYTGNPSVTPTVILNCTRKTRKCSTHSRYSPWKSSSVGGMKLHGWKTRVVGKCLELFTSP